MDESARKPLIDPVYEQEVKLKADLVKNVYENCLKKLINGTEYIPTSARLRAIRYTGIPQSVYPNPEQKKIKLSNKAKMEIRPIIEEIIKDHYIKKQVLPVLKHIINANISWIAAVKNNSITKPVLSVLLNNNNLPDVIKKLGFKWQKLPGTNKKFIIEHPEYVNARHKYLKCLKKYRDEHRKIIYLDVLNLTEKLEGNWTTTHAETKANFVIIAILPATGMVCKAHCGKSVRARTLETMLRASRLEDSAEDSVIIFGDDHGAMGDLHRLPTTNSSRSEMTAFLEDKEIPYSEGMHKCELLDLCQNFVTRSPTQARWEAIWCASGRLVLRRPRWMHDFGIFHQFWPRTHFDQRLTKTKMTKNIDLIIEHVERTKWAQLEETLIEKEESCMNMDKLIEDEIENVLALVKRNNLSQEDLDSNDFDDIPSSDEEM